MAFGGETASDKKAKTRLANMREEDAEVAEGRQKQQREDRLERYRRNISMDDLKAAQKQGKTYDKWFEDNRKAQLKEGILRQDAYDEGKGYEMLTPTQHRQALTSSGMKKGGEVKESKAMVNKEVAFFKKKGAPAKMIKHEMSEMKGMKAGGKVRRMAYGGMGEGDPFARDIDYEKEKERGAKTVEGIKNFLGFGKKEETKPNPIPVEGSKPVSSNSPTANAVISSAVKTQERAPAPNNRTLPVLNEESGNKDRMLSGPQFTSSIVDRGEGEYSGDGISPAKRDESRNRPATVSRTRQTTSVTPAKSKTPANANYRKLLNDAEQEILSKTKAEEDALRKKPTAMTEQMRKAPSIRELYKGQKSMGDEIGDALKSFRASIRSGLKVGEERSKNRNAEASAAKGGQVKKMAQGGYAKADGVASRGKTQPKMVKMASGGFVKSADGCAQRGKTKAFQVKMSRGGKC